MALFKFEYKNPSEKSGLLGIHNDKFLLRDSGELVSGVKKFYLIFSDTDPDSIKTSFKGLSWGNVKPDTIETYIENNVTDLASAKEVLKIMGKAILLLARKSL